MLKYLHINDCVHGSLLYIKQRVFVHIGKCVSTRFATV